MVIGGGLTSAQIGGLAIRRGVTKVWHIMRGPLRYAEIVSISHLHKLIWISQTVRYRPCLDGQIP